MSLRELDYVKDKLAWMRAEEIWPNGQRYLWTDAFGVVLLLSLHEYTGAATWREQAEALVEDVYRVLGRRRGLRIGEAPDRGGQYYHYLAMWLFALQRFGQFDPAYRTRAIALAKDIHGAFVLPGRGVLWKMEEDLSAPCPGYGLGAMDAYDGYVVYRLLDTPELDREIAQMAALMKRDYRSLEIDQDLGLGMMLWLSHFFPKEAWARAQRARALMRLERLWIDDPGYFCRSSQDCGTRFAFTNYGISLGLQALQQWPAKVTALNDYFETYRSGDAYDRDAITHVMACTSRFPGLFLARG